MSDPATPPGDPASPPGDPAEPTDDEVIAYAHRMLDLARDGDPQLLDVVDAGLPVNLAAPTGDTLLMLAAYHGRTDTVRGLLARGADPHRINDRGQSVLSAAVFKGEAEIVDALLAAGADPTAGQPNALETARFYRPELEERLHPPAG